jgi:hypothetical protein
MPSATRLGAGDRLALHCRPRAPLALGLEFREKVPDERRDVFLPFTQRRQLHRITFSR